jgi:hypothetical protein
VFSFSAFTARNPRNALTSSLMQHPKDIERLTDNELRTNVELCFFKKETKAHIREYRPYQKKKLNQADSHDTLYHFILLRGVSNVQKLK